MDLYLKMLVFYAVMAVLSAIATWFLSKETRTMKTLSACLVGATWPISFPVALAFSLF
ncbi:GhoT/OrtT family toxin [Metakosakonia massiliensis]|uniref:GhoT/OrtT family toxin n=1 Tax=Phytobacter massiliensis TaxID=1485952 RepID=A0A6N3HU67_9ENTR|nr:GhoT/OrtT family toxin [Phytobacter massiliensis]